MIISEQESKERLIKMINKDLYLLNLKTTDKTKIMNPKRIHKMTGLPLIMDHQKIIAKVEKGKII